MRTGWARLKPHRYWLEPVGFSLGMLLLASLWVLPDWIRSGSGMRFQNPWFLLGLLAVPLVIAAGVRSRKSSGRLVHPLAAVMAMQKRGWRTWLLPVSVGLRAVLTALVVIALARPQDSTQRGSVHMEGIDIVLTLDLSGSMATPDIPPSRVEAAKEVVLDFVQRRKNDRIGAVVFAENAYTLCPLTLDYSVLSQMIAELQLGVIDDRATAIGNAVGVSLNRLRKSDAESKTIILLTDGTSNAGNISPDQAIEFARTLGVRIYTILVGRNENTSAINPELLISMAEKTNGAFFTAEDKSELVSSFHTILDALERSKIEDQGVTYAEVFGKYLFAALLLGILDLLLTVIVMRRTP
ncbi:MAG: VWA domain-containing protein [Deltaproteobacteria bacterium]|nr:VWA domain-containing protein [Deltaproteobacteria bacterium]MBN2670176.1 VWA domain-containing protein [Deltaproteobacteria bacterium]